MNVLSSRKPAYLALAVCTVGALTLSACSGETNSAKVEKTEAASTASSAGSQAVTTASKSASEATAGEISVQSCDRTITLEKAPERVIFQNATGVAQLVDLDLLDRAVARSGSIDPAIYGPEAAAKIEAVELLKGADSGHGHIKLSTEAILEEKPDLVLGFPSGLDLEKVEASGVPVYVPQAYCPGANTEPAKFDKIYTDLERMGVLFGVTEKADAVEKDLGDRIAAVRDADNSALAGKTVAMVYITPGDSGTISTYGNTSMAHAQIETLGMTNAYADQDDRVTDVSIEDLLERDPDYVILLHTKGTPEEILSTFGEVRGSADLKAAREDGLHTMAYPLVDPASPLSVKGLETLRAQLLEGAENS